MTASTARKETKKAPKERAALTVVPDDGEALATLDREIEETKQARATLDSDYKAGKAEIAERRERLENARRSLLRNARPRRARERGPLVAEKQAGKRNIAAVEKAAEKKGEATQAELAVASGVGTGSMTWAIRALVERGRLTPTGERRDGSNIFRYVPEKRSKVRRPGE